MIPDPWYKQTVLEAARFADLDPDVLLALVLTENATGDPCARRYEPAFFERYIHEKPPWTEDPWYPVPLVIASSYGLAQVMYTTALWVQREKRLVSRLLWDATPWGLFNPGANLRIAAAVLAYKARRYGSLRLGFSAYNAGRPCARADGTLENEDYVRRAASWLDRIGSKVTLE